MTGRAHYLAATGNIGPVGGKGTGACLYSITVGTGTASAVLTVYDGQDSTTGTVIAVIDASAKGYYPFKCVCPSGVLIVQSGAAAKVTAVIS